MIELAQLSAATLSMDDAGGDLFSAAGAFCTLVSLWIDE